jgi:two-component system cell cycle sensor histidine kinase/response regulator CckA
MSGVEQQPFSQPPAAQQQHLEDTARVVQRLAHDFGNLLTSIQGFTELALSQLPSAGSARPADPSLHSYLSEVLRTAQQAGQFVQQLRLFSRRGTPPKWSVNPATVLAEEVTRLQAVAEPGVELHLHLPEDVPPVRLEADMLRQVLGAILANAREALPVTGHIRVTAGLTELTPASCATLMGNPLPGAFLEVTVHDTGVGIPSEVREQLLSDLFVSTKPGHRGLGLATVYGILHLHRGGFRLEPGDDGGTCARLFFPVAEAVARSSHAADGGGVQGERVLVVDDDPRVLQFISTTLERAGYRVHSTGCGSEALAAYTASTPEPFRLVLSDVLMPRMSGVDLARRLLHHDAGVNLLFMSGHISTEFAQENFGNWNFELLQKPFRPDGLLQAVRNALERAPQPPRKRSGGPEPSATCVR